MRSSHRRLPSSRASSTGWGTPWTLIRTINLPAHSYTITKWAAIGKLITVCFLEVFKCQMWKQRIVLTRISSCSFSSRCSHPRGRPRDRLRASYPRHGILRGTLRRGKAPQLCVRFPQPLHGVPVKLNRKTNTFRQIVERAASLIRRNKAQTNTLRYIEQISTTERPTSLIAEVNWFLKKTDRAN